ncbi:DNA breaking-rejoining protein [Escherichia coli]|uniref:DNA breaking-rejoining protein n=1 Tax=Escherichia coli TaxID=562 RepID=UPI0006887026|nr:DNA breaking-rejoining protein [Escherichia coli]
MLFTSFSGSLVSRIPGAVQTVIPGETLAELNALSGPAVSLVVFSSGYRPRRGDRVVYDGQQWTVTRHERFNGKPMIFIE